MNRHNRMQERSYVLTGEDVPVHPENVDGGLAPTHADLGIVIVEELEEVHHGLVVYVFEVDLPQGWIAEGEGAGEDGAGVDADEGIGGGEGAPEDGCVQTVEHLHLFDLWMGFG